MSFNPALNKVNSDARSNGQPRYGQYATPEQQTQAMYGLTTDQQAMSGLENAYAAPAAGPAQTGRVTVTDVLAKTGLLLALCVGTAGAVWAFVQGTPELSSPIWLAGMLGSLVLSFVIGMMKRVNVPLILLHAVLQGAFLGAVSATYERAYDGIVPTAVVATISTLLGMYAAYSVGLIKVTSRSRRIFGMLAMGYLVFLLVNLALSFFAGWSAFSSPIGWLIGLFGVAMAAYSLAVDFDSVDNAVASGLPEQYSWLLGHGLLASLVWLYIEFLRLLGIMRSND